ncbi:UNVERIFIED_CONTAM: hypothetical protein FKN15_071606 [Acipenser sinensis]
MPGSECDEGNVQPWDSEEMQTLVSLWADRSVQENLQFCVRNEKVYAQISDLKQMDINRGYGHIGSLQAMQMTHEAAIRDLESEKSRLKDKLTRLEEERGLLQSKSQSMDESQKQQILALEKALKDAKQSYEKEMVNIRARYEEEAALFKETQAKALEELSKKHRATVETTQSTGERERKMLQTITEHEPELQPQASENPDFTTHLFTTGTVFCLHLLALESRTVFVFVFSVGVGTGPWGYGSNP